MKTHALIDRLAKSILILIIYGVSLQAQASSHSSSAKSEGDHKASSHTTEELIIEGVPLIAQTTPWGCFDAAVQMVLKYNKLKYLPVKDIEKIKKDGLEAEQIDGFFNFYNLYGASAKEHKLSALLKLHGPIIAVQITHIKKPAHVIVITGISGKHIFYNDPAKDTPQSMLLINYNSFHPLLYILKKE
jgi:hypothetical protein